MRDSTHTVLHRSIRHGFLLLVMETLPWDSTQYAANATVTVLGNTGSLSWPGFTFTGWDTADRGGDGGGGGGTFYASGSTFTITSNVVLYDTWNP